jgi:hypothetical protein
MKQSFEQALAMLEAQGKPSIFRILMKPVAPTIVHMFDTLHVSEVPAALAPLGDAPLGDAPLGDAPLGGTPIVDVTPTPPSTPETPKPIVFITPLRYELHTVVVLKKWWAALSCKQCKTAEKVGFPVKC